ncbi:MAG: glycosyltransferase family 2 protein [Hydrococcus sp. Prado102]|jgi:glycosyltransferase involved in cell wall biosynthesis|nr:glycosyltransferase family 2 protein [Hydrococcus sp. Prado102]
MEAPVSVIIPCYRCSNTIQRALDSIANQTLRPAEVILVDDRSDDNTIEVLKQLQNEYGQNWIKVIALNSNGGPSGARNTGWEIASQEYIAFLDADDAWHPEKIAIQYSWMANHSDIILSGHDCLVVTLDKQFNETLEGQNLEGKTISKNKILFFGLLPISTWMLKTSLTYRFNTNQRYCEDYLFLLSLILSGCSVTMLNFPMSYRFRPYFSEGGLGGELWKMEIDHLNSYYITWQAGKLSSIELVVVSIWSIIKYLRREVLNRLRKIDRFLKQSKISVNTKL